MDACYSFLSEKVFHPFSFSVFYGVGPHRGRSLGIGRKRPYKIGEHADVGAAQSMYLSITLHHAKTEERAWVLAPLRKLAKITAEKVNHAHRYKVGHWVLLSHRFVSNVYFLVLFLWLWFLFL